MSIKGIDISFYQSGLTDFSLLRNGGYEFAICKITEGQAMDTCFNQHYENLKKHGMAIGAYVFSHATNARKAKAEAEYAVKVLNGRKLDLPIFLDMEAEDINFGWNVSTMPVALAFGEAIKAAGYKWGIYASQSWWRYKLNIDEIKAAGGVVWCTEYTGRELTTDCDIWQYANNGKVPGYSKKVDLNMMLNTALLDGKVEEVEQPKQPEQVEEDKEEGATVMTANEAINRLVACAKAQVGYLEKRSNAQLDDAKANAGTKNWNKYARDIDSKFPEFYNGKKNGYAWCDIFVDWCFINTFGYENALKLLCAPENSTGAGCTYSARFYRNKGQFHNKPKVGDQVFFGDVGNEGHTGIVVAVDGDYITTVEGNTSGGNGVDANGDGVYMKRYNTKTQYIPGYGRPDYSIVANTVLPEQPVVQPEKEPEKTEEKVTGGDNMCNVKLPMLRQGADNGYVVALQATLIKRGFSVGIWGADGDFGSGTLKAVKNFQSKKGLEVDGIVGEQTWAALLRG